MAYALKYTGTLIDHFGRTLRVDISENNYSGSSSNLTLAGVNKNINGSDDNLFVSRMGSEISVGLLSGSDFQFIDLYTGDSRKYRLEVFIDNVLDWTGWVIPENFSEPYDGTPYVTSISARDGLGELSSTPYDYFGVQKSLVVLLACLNKLNLLNLNVSVNIYEQNQNTAGDTSLNQTYVDTERYRGMNCGEVVQDLLNLWGARIYQKDAEWWFVNVVEYESRLITTKYGAIGNYISQSDVNTELFIGLPKDDKFADTDQTLNLLPAWRSYDINVDLGKKDSFIGNWDFTQWKIIGYEQRGDNPNSPIYAPEKWVIFSDIQTKRLISGEQSALIIGSIDSVPNGAIFQGGPFVKTGNKNLSFVLDYGLYSADPNFLGQIWIKISILETDPITESYLTSEGQWSETESYINLQNIRHKSIFTRDYTYDKYEITSEGIPIDGQLQIVICRPDAGLLLIDNFKGILRDDNLNEYPDDFEYTKIVNYNNRSRAEDLSLLTADLQDVGNETSTPSSDLANERLVYRGGLFLDTEARIPTEKWESNEISGKLQDVVFNQKKNKVNLPQWAITGTVLSKTIKTDSVLIDYEVNNNRYLVCNGNYDMEACKFNGTFIQIGNADSAGWILGEPSGIWNDGNNWDDNGQWVDSAQAQETINLSGTGSKNITAYVEQGDTITILPNENGTRNDDDIRDGGLIDPISTVPYVITNTTVSYIVDAGQTSSYVAYFDAIVSGVNTRFTVNVTI